MKDVFNKIKFHKKQWETCIKLNIQQHMRSIGNKKIRYSACFDLENMPDLGN